MDAEIRLRVHKYRIATETPPGRGGPGAPRLVTVDVRWRNQGLLQEGHSFAVFGIVSNGQVWQFYQLTPAGEVFESGLFAIERLPELLGMLDYVCAECAKNVPDPAAPSPK